MLMVPEQRQLPFDEKKPFLSLIVVPYGRLNIESEYPANFFKRRPIIL